MDVEIISIVIVLGAILISMTLHEAMHAFTSYWLGDDTAEKQGRLTLNPLVHIDPFLTVILPLGLFLLGSIPIGAAKPVPFNPYRVRYHEFGAALVGIAGPLTNLVLAIITGLWARFIFTGVTAEYLELFMLVNLSFFVFNMIPWPPLDGSRVLYAFAPEPLQKFMRQVESFGLLGFFLFYFLLFSVISPIVGELVTSLAELILGRPFI